MPILGSLVNDNGHRWDLPISELPRCTRCFAFEYQCRAFRCPVPLARIPEDFAPRSRRRRALEKRLERRRVKLDDLRTFPDYFTCSACKRPTREAPAGLALGIRTQAIDWEAALVVALLVFIAAMSITGIVLGEGP